MFAQKITEVCVSETPVFSTTNRCGYCWPLLLAVAEHEIAQKIAGMLQACVLRTDDFGQKIVSNAICKERQRLITSNCLLAKLPEMRFRFEGMQIILYWEKDA